MISSKTSPYTASTKRYNLIIYIMFIPACNPGNYGKNCDKDCGHCRQGIVCINTNGTCPSGCSSGYQGALCITGQYHWVSVRQNKPHRFCEQLVSNNMDAGLYLYLYLSSNTRKLVSRRSDHVIQAIDKTLTFYRHSRIYEFSWLTWISPFTKYRLPQTLTDSRLFKEEINHG